MSKKTDREFVNNFKKILQKEGDMFFSTGDVTKDAEIIKERIKTQGFWAGNSVRYIFDKRMKLEAIQPRMFT